MDLPINSIICGECSKIMAEWPNDCIDLTVTSPPYDNLRDYKGYEFPFEAIAKQLYRVTKPGGVVIWIVGDATIDGSETGTSFKQALYFKEIGFNLHDTMIYASKKPPLTHNRYEQKFEYMFVFSKGRPKIFNPIKVRTLNAGKLHNYGAGPDYDAKHEVKDAMRYRQECSMIKQEQIKGNIWEYLTGPNTTKDSEAYRHPAIFPEGLARDHIKSWSNEGDIVLDPMCGSGTTCKAATQLGRKYIGIDISDEYCNIARNRVQSAEKIKEIIDDNKLDW